VTSQIFGTHIHVEYFQYLAGLKREIVRDNRFFTPHTPQINQTLTLLGHRRASTDILAARCLEYMHVAAAGKNQRESWVGGEGGST
jgi:hypothetical protein